MRNLKRVAGNPIVAEFSLVSKPRKRVADPNGYYEVLGLDPSNHYSQDEIKSAYREQVKLFHPDGAAPDAEVFDMIQTAYEVLSDPANKQKYDELDGNHVWLDKKMTALLVRKMHAAGLLQPKDVVAEEVKREMQRHGFSEPDPVTPRAQFDTYCYYYYEGEEVPDQETRQGWFDAVKRAMWEMGMRGQEAKVGFTTGPSHVLEKPWGKVLMYSGEPSVESALEILGVRLTPALEKG